MTPRNEPGVFVLILALLLIVAPAAAQAPRPETSVDEVPELAGAERVTGTVLVDGHLPAPWLDYVVELGPGRSQKLTLYQNGLVTLVTRIEDRRSLKQVLFPPGAIETYKEHLTGKLLEGINQQPLIGTPTRLRETIRIYDDEGEHVERRYDPALYLPSDLEGARALLQDLSRIIIEDNELTNPWVDYQPRKGDRLLDQEMEAWDLLRIVDGHLEVQKENTFIRVWLKIDQLDEQFVNWSRPSQNSE